jgi:hypothetical protein
MHSAVLRACLLRVSLYAASGETRPTPIIAWEQKAAGSNPAIPTKHAGRGACSGALAWLTRSSDRHLTVKLNVSRRQRLSRTGPQGHGIRAVALLMLNRLPVLIHVGMEPRLDLSAAAGRRSLKAEADQPLHLPAFLSPCDELGQLVTRDATQFPDLQATELVRTEQAVHLVPAHLENLRHLLNGVGLKASQAAHCSILSLSVA